MGVFASNKLLTAYCIVEEMKATAALEAHINVRACSRVEGA